MEQIIEQQQKVIPENSSLKFNPNSKVDFLIDRLLLSKIELMIKRITDDDENDNYLIIDGDTGSGKTNMSVGIAYLVAQATGRTFDNSRVFFDTNEAVNFAKKTREQIIIFDEPAFGGLKSEWRKKTQINLIKLLYTARVKRHFVIFNLVKFCKFSDDIIEKAVALLRIYRQDESQKRRSFLYIPHKNIPSLMDFWHRKHIRAYYRFKTFRGNVFRYVLPEIIDKQLYNEQKDKAIEMIGDDDEKIDLKTKKLHKLQSGIVKFIKEKKITQEEIAPYLGVARNTLSEWGKLGEKDPISLEIPLEMSTVKELIIDNHQT